MDWIKEWLFEAFLPKGIDIATKFLIKSRHSQLAGFRTKVAVVLVDSVEEFEGADNVLEVLQFLDTENDLLRAEIRKEAHRRGLDIT